MADGTREDYLLLDQSERDFAAGLPDRVLGALRNLDNTLEGYPVSRLEHSLQVATRAEAAGADEELGARGTDPRHRRRARSLQPRRSGSRHPAAIRATGSHLDRRAAWAVPDLLLRSPSRRRPPCARAPQGPPVVRRPASPSAIGTRPHSTLATRRDRSNTSSRSCGASSQGRAHDPRYVAVEN